MTLSLYTDTHIAKAVAIQLQQRGVDVVRCEEVGMAEAKDLEHLAFATAQGRAIVTNDQGFAGHHQLWLAQGNHHSGIFLITKDKDNIGLLVTVLEFWHRAVEAGAAVLAQDVHDQVIYIP